MINIPYIETPTTLTMVVEDKPYTIDNTHLAYKKIRKAVIRGRVKSQDWLLDLITPLKAFTKIIDTTAMFTYDGSTLHCEVDGFDFPIPGDIYATILKLYAESGDIEPLLRFVTKLARNPRRETISELWGFLSSCGLALTASGNFLAYKNVRTDFKDTHSGTMDNSPGTVVEMPRHAVEHDPSRTCAAGLHFAAWGYLQHYAWGGKTLILSISPEDVVSIPTDYGNQKGRACKYEVLREVEQPEELKHHVIYTDDEGYAHEDENPYAHDYDCAEGCEHYCHENNCSECG